MKTSELNSRLVNAIKSFFAEQGKQKAVLGLSGGIDSALVLSLLCEAIGKENVAALLMPNPEITKYSSTTDAQDFANKLGVKSLVIPIDKIISSFSKITSPVLNSISSGYSSGTVSMSSPLIMFVMQTPNSEDV